MKLKNKRKRSFAVLSALLLGTCLPGAGMGAAAGGGSLEAEDTQDWEVVELTERVAGIYPICPELLQAIIFYESGNRMDVENRGCIGYMQVSEQWHSGRADKLGVSLHDGYGNILTGTDYLMDLFREHGDVGAALMAYHGEKDAAEKAGRGEVSSYASKILGLSEELERMNGK